MNLHRSGMNERKILVTSALPYANGSIHLGHLVEYIQTDIWVRFQKMRGHTVYYVCADDTHGTPIMLRAEKEGITPESLIARVHQEHLKDFTGFHIQFDNYYSTHSAETRFFSEDIYHKLKNAGLISVRAIEQLYDPVKNMFLPDRFVKGVSEVRCEGSIRRLLRGLWRSLCADRTQKSLLVSFRRQTNTKIV